MITKKHRRVEIALLKVPPQSWATSNEVSLALLTCNHVKMMVRNAMVRNYIKNIYEEEIASETAYIMQTKVIAGGLSDGDRVKGQLQKIEDVYYLIYQTINDICLNYKKKRVLTINSLEGNFSSFATEESDGDEFVMDMINENDSFDHFEEVDRNLDLELAKRRLAKKLANNGWPEYVPKERTIKGRPYTQSKEKIKNPTS